MFKEKKKGFECEEKIDGTRSCKRFISKKGEAYATGTDVEISVDSNTCKGRTTGRVMEEDKQSVYNELKEAEDRCKKGI